MLKFVKQRKKARKDYWNVLLICWATSIFLLSIRNWIYCPSHQVYTSQIERNNTVGTVGFHANQIVLVWSCVKRLGTNGFKFPVKGNFPVILSSMVCTEPVRAGNNCSVVL